MWCMYVKLIRKVGICDILFFMLFIMKYSIVKLIQFGNKMRNSKNELDQECVLSFIN